MAARRMATAARGRDDDEGDGAAEGDDDDGVDDADVTTPT